MSVSPVRGSRAGALIRGFSLIELFVTISVVAILLAAALPSFRELGIRMNVSGTTNDLVGALNTARAEAAKRAGWVAVIGNGSDWSAGWRVEADGANPPTPPDHNFTGAAPDVVIQRYAALDAHYSVTTKVTGGADSRVVFGPAGNLVDGATKVSINVCRPDGKASESRWIRVLPSGEITSMRDTSNADDDAPGC